MEHKLLRYGLLFAIMLGFTAFSLGIYTTAFPSVHAASDKHQLVSVTEPVFNAKFLGFLAREKVCTLSTESVNTISAAYPTTTKTMSVGGEDRTVVSVNGTPLNKHVLEDLTGETLGDCQVVHGNHMIAFLTPTIVS